MPVLQERELEEITKGELLLIHRRRLKMTQKKAADSFSVPLNVYWKWERNIGKVPYVKIEALLPHECCFLYRRRAKFTQARVAKEMDICRYWLMRMELGLEPCDELLGYWES